MPFIDPAELEVGRPRPDWEGRLFHSEHVTIVYYDIAPGSDVHPAATPARRSGTSSRGSWR